MDQDIRAKGNAPPILSARMCLHYMSVGVSVLTSHYSAHE